MEQAKKSEESLVLYGAAILAGGLVAYSALNGGGRAKRAGKLSSGWIPRLLRGDAKLTERALTINRSIVDVFSAWRKEFSSGLKILEEVNNEHVSWRDGEVLFRRAPSGRGTEVHLRLRGAGANKALEDLRKFKMMMETGEIATIEGQSKGA